MALTSMSFRKLSDYGQIVYALAVGKGVYDEIFSDSPFTGGPPAIIILIIRSDYTCNQFSFFFLALPRFFLIMIPARIRTTAPPAA